VNNENQKPRSVDDILTEQELLDLLGIRKSALDRLRHEQQLPFCKITNTNRVYLVRDVLEFIENRRTVLNIQA